MHFLNKKTFRISNFLPDGHAQVRIDSDEMASQAPLVKIDEDFEQCYAKDSLSLDETISKVTSVYRDVLASAHTLKQVPSVTQRRLCSALGLAGRVVRFTGMIQDQQQAEFYTAVVTSTAVGDASNKRLNCGLFRSDICLPDGHSAPDTPPDASSIRERQVFTAVAVPGMTDWAQAHYNHTDDDAAGDKVLADVKQHERHLPLHHTAAASDNELLNLCKVKVYTDEQIKLNELHTFVGILEVTTKADGADEMETDAASNKTEKQSAENDKENSKPGVEFELHVMSSVRLPHANPLPTDASLQTDTDVRVLIVSQLTTVLAGDALAAELLLLHLISSVINRTGVVIVGKLAMNLTGLTHDDPAIDNLMRCLRQWLTLVDYLPMSIEHLNARPFVPRKDYATDALCTGRLQLAGGTELVVDETRLSTGQLNQTGLRNVAALQTLMACQKLDYDFQFHALEFPTDVNVLVLSEAKSMLTADVRVRLKPTTDSQRPAQLTPAQLDAVRAYFTHVRSARDEFSIGDEVQRMIEEDFVLMRQNNPGVTGEHLSQTVLLARLLSVSMQQQSLSVDNWKRAKVLETVIASRNDA